MRTGRMLLACIAACVMLCTAAGAQEKAEWKIGVCQLQQHAALEDATRGFMDAVDEILGERCIVSVQHASGDQASCISIVNAFLAEDVDLIIANSTQALQSASAATGDTPILGVAVTDYAAALDKDTWEGKTGVNVSGTSDLAPLDSQAELLKAMFPEAKKVGLLYCSAEPNSKYQVDTIQALLETAGLTCEMFAFADSNDMQAVVNAACEYSDVIYVPTDNAVASSKDIIDSICRPAGIPIIAGEEGICSGCGVATLSISYYDLGVKTGKMAAQILSGEADISEMEISYADNFTKKYNAANCEALGLSVPDGYEAIAAE